MVGDFWTCPACDATPTGLGALADKLYATEAPDDFVPEESTGAPEPHRVDHLDVALRRVNEEIQAELKAAQMQRAKDDASARHEWWRTRLAQWEPVPGSTAAAQLHTLNEEIEAGMHAMSQPRVTAAATDYRAALTAMVQSWTEHRERSYDFDEDGDVEVLHGYRVASARGLDAFEVRMMYGTDAGPLYAAVHFPVSLFDGSHVWPYVRDKLDRAADQLMDDADYL